MKRFCLFAKELLGSQDCQIGLNLVLLGKKLGWPSEVDTLKKNLNGCPATFVFYYGSWILLQILAFLGPGGPARPRIQAKAHQKWWGASRLTILSGV